MVENSKETPRRARSPATTTAWITCTLLSNRLVVDGASSTTQCTLSLSRGRAVLRLGDDKHRRPNAELVAETRRRRIGGNVVEDGGHHWLQDART